MKKILHIHAVGRRRFATLFFGIFALSSTVVLTPLGTTLESELGLPWLYRLREPVSPPSDVVLIKMDELTANALGAGVGVERWPRTLHACLLNKLSRMSPALIVMDIFFAASSEPDAGGAPDAIEKQFNPQVASECDLRSGDDATVQLGAAVSASRKVLLTSNLGRLRVGSLEINSESFPDERVSYGALGFAPFPLAESGERINHFWTYFRKDPDQIATTEIPTLASLAVDALTEKGPLFDSLALRNAMIERRRKAAEMMPSGASREPLTNALEKMYREAAIRVINIYGPPGSFHEASYAEVLGAAPGSVVAEKIKNAVVFIGAAEHYSNSRIDSYHTFYPDVSGKKYGGVELLATAFLNLRDGTELHILRGWQLIALIGVMCLTVATAAWYLELVPAMYCAVALLCAYTILAIRMFAGLFVWLPVITPISIVLPLALIGTGLLRYLHSQAIWTKILSEAKKFVPGRVLDLPSEASTAPYRVVFGALLATDAADFTKVIAKIGPEPERFMPLLSEYYRSICSPVQDVLPAGTVIDTAGDGMLAAWDAEQDSLEVRRAACLAACRIRAEVKRFNDSHPESQLPTRLGLHAGEVAIGVLEAGQRCFYKAVGDVTNTASRIEGLNKHLGTALLASEAVTQGLQDEFLLRPCGRFLLPGRLQPISIHEIVARLGEATSEQTQLVHAFGGALQLFQNGQWESAAAALNEVLNRTPTDGPSQFLANECRRRAGIVNLDNDAASIIVIKQK